MASNAREQSACIWNQDLMQYTVEGVLYLYLWPTDPEESRGGEIGGVPYTQPSLISHLIKQLIPGWECYYSFSFRSRPHACTYSSILYLSTISPWTFGWYANACWSIGFSRVNIVLYQIMDIAFNRPIHINVLWSSWNGIYQAGITKFMDAKSLTTPLSEKHFHVL